MATQIDYAKAHADALDLMRQNEKPTAAEERVAWQAYVTQEINRMLDAGINPRYKDSWMLRKGVRAHVPLPTLQRLFAAGPQLPDPADNQAEAYRYALMDERSPESLGNLMPILPLAEPMLATVAAVMLNGPLALECARLSIEESPASREALASTFLCLGVPLDLMPEWLRPPGTDVLPSLGPMWLRTVWNSMHVVDDRDNYLTLDGFSVLRAGLSISAEKAQRDVYMAPWLGEDTTQYVARLGEVLASRFNTFQLLGAGAYGVVLYVRRGDASYALKLTALAHPLGGESRESVRVALDELTFQMKFTQDSLLPEATDHFVWYVDHTRGSMDASAVVTTLTKKKSSTAVPGAGIYLAIQMPLFEFTLADWLMAAGRASGDNSVALAAMTAMLTGIMAVILGQLILMRKAVQGFQHNDLHANNIMLRRITSENREAPVFSTAARIFRAHPDIPSITVLPSHTGGYAPTVSDFGRASGFVDRKLGPDGRKNVDLPALAALLPTHWLNPGAKLQSLRANLRTTNDDATAAAVARLFAEVDVLRVFVKP